MDRRKSLKAIALGTVSTGLLLDACKLADKKEATKNAPAADNTGGNATGINRMKEEAAYEKQLTSATFFTKEEMATITILGDIIIPKDDVSGSASDAKVDYAGWICNVLNCIIIRLQIATNSSKWK